MFSSPRSVCRSIASLLAFGLMMQVSAIAAHAQQVTEKTSDAKLQHSVTGEHQKEQIGEILKRAHAGLERVNKEVQDYQCILIKQEQVEGKLRDMQFMQVKIRHEQRDGDTVTVPFSVYVKFLKPQRVVDREVLYVKGRNNGDLIARRGGRRSADMTVELEPENQMAMDGNRYPITEIGFVTLVQRLIEVMENEIQPDNCEIKVFEDAKLDGRLCTHFELNLLKKQENTKFMSALVFVDNELRVPTHYAAYDWPEKEGDKPVMLEAYTYRKLKVNVGLTDKDFDRDNPEYKFSKTEPIPTEVEGQ
jgi:hypothetical protein